MDIVFVQTADQIRYRIFLEVTSQTVREYCARHGFNYESFLGIARGFHAWQATYNRISILRRWADSGFSGWICYLDADAYIADLAFDLRAYLADKADVSLIAAPSGIQPRRWWDVNAGVLFINLAHPIGRAIVYDWSKRFDQITDQQLRDAPAWSQVVDDQGLLQQALRSVPEAEQCIGLEETLINYEHGQFIKQVLRSHRSFDDRIQRLQSEAARILGTDRALSLATNPTSADVAMWQEMFVIALYRVLLLREPDPPGLASALGHVGKGLSIEDAIRSCLRSEEFLRNHQKFLETYVRSASGPAVHRASRSAPPSKPLTGPRPQTTNLTRLANKYRSDKGTEHGSPPHKYSYLYDLIFFPFKNDPINILELGLAAGGPEIGGPIQRTVDAPSVRMWLDYFPNARIFGFDISNFSHMMQSRFQFVQGDSGSDEDLQRLSSSCCSFDIVIDDASHASYHQQLAFRHLFPKLAGNGLYVIEDLHWQPPEYEAKLPPVPKTGEFFASYFEQASYLENSVLTEDIMEDVAEQIASFSLFPSFSDAANPVQMIVLRKRA